MTTEIIDLVVRRGFDIRLDNKPDTISIHVTIEKHGIKRYSLFTAEEFAEGEGELKVMADMVDLILKGERKS